MQTVPECIGVITWMHTFSPAKCGLKDYRTIINPTSPTYAIQQRNSVE